MTLRENRDETSRGLEIRRDDRVCRQNQSDRSLEIGRTVVISERYETGSIFFDVCVFQSLGEMSIGEGGKENR